MPQPLVPFFFQPIVGEHFREQRFHSCACLVRRSSGSAACFSALCHDLNTSILDALNTEIPHIGIQKNCAILGVHPKKSENNLRTKRPKYHAKRGYKTQVTARRCITMYDLRKSTGCRFESCPVHQNSNKNKAFCDSLKGSVSEPPNLSALCQQNFRIQGDRSVLSAYPGISYKDAKSAL
jgi:hypothetical protein